MSARRVVLLRHGRTAWNAERRFQGQADPPLDHVGRMQAYEVAALVAAVRPDVLVSSDAARAVQTAEAVATATGLSVRCDPRLRERSLGHWEGLTRDEVAERYPDEFADWVAGRDVSRRGGETRDQVAVRALAALTDVPDVPVAVLVTHSATAMALCTALLGLEQRVHVLSPLANCHWTELVREGDGADPRRAARVGRPVRGLARGPVRGTAWRLRAHNVGVPGTVVPLPVPLGSDEDASDADA